MLLPAKPEPYGRCAHKQAHKQATNGWPKTKERKICITKLLKTKWIHSNVCVYILNTNTKSRLNIDGTWLPSVLSVLRIIISRFCSCSVHVWSCVRYLVFCLFIASYLRYYYYLSRSKQANQIRLDGAYVYVLKGSNEWTRRLSQSISLYSDDDKVIAFDDRWAAAVTNCFSYFDQIHPWLPNRIFNFMACKCLIECCVTLEVATIYSKTYSWTSFYFA